MKRFFTNPSIQAIAVVLIIVSAGLLLGQSTTAVDLARQSQNPDFSAFSFTRPVTVGSALPSTCLVGQLFFNTSAPAGSNLYGCTASGTWVVLGGATIAGGTTSSSTGTSGTVLLGGVPVANTAPQNMQTLVYNQATNSYVPTSVYSIQNGLGTTVSGITNAQVNVSMGIRTVTGTSDVLLPTDCGGLVIYNNPAPVSVAVPTPALPPTSFVAGCPITVRNYGIGPVTFNPTSGVWIGNQPTQGLNPNSGGLLVSDGKNWQLGFWN